MTRPVIFNSGIYVLKNESGSLNDQESLLWDRQ